MQKLLLSAAGAVLASSMMITPAQAFWGSWGGGPWYGGPWYGGYPYYGGWGGGPWGGGWGGYPGYGGWGYPYGGWGGYPWGGYGYPVYAAPQVTAPSSSKTEK